MIRIRRGAERGHADHGWLDSRFTFSFADYYDPAHTAFRSLRVMNEDVVAPGAGFPMHGHRDMEIVTIVLEGALEHKDSIGNGEVLRPGEVQHMTAGTGILHSEFNPSATEPTHLSQIWLLPDRNGHAPGYGQKAFAQAERKGRWQLVASPDGADGSLPIHQDARLLLADVEKGGTSRHSFSSGRHGWLQLLRGRVRVNGRALTQGDGAALSEEASIRIEADSVSELLLFDLA